MDRRGFLKLLGGAGAGAAVSTAGIKMLPLAGDELGDIATKTVEASDAAIPDNHPGLSIQQTLWSVPTRTNLVALTFDDGPDPEFTPTILGILDRFGVRATFNVMGWNALQHSALLKQAVSAGHEIGNHTWTHKDLAFESAESTSAQLRDGKNAIENVVETRVRFFRPPRGELTGSAIRAAAELRYDILMWSVGRGPAGVGKPADVSASVLGNLVPGAIVCLHDGIGRGTFDRNSSGSRFLRNRRHVEIEALPAILEGAKAKGLAFTTASELLAAASPA